MSNRNYVANGNCNVIIIMVILCYMLLFLNGFYYPLFLKIGKSVVWGVDIVQTLIVFIVMTKVYLKIKDNLVAVKSSGNNILITVVTNGFHYIIVPLLFYYIYIVSIGSAAIIFPKNYLYQYSLQNIPLLENKLFIIPFCLIIAVEEELLFRVSLTYILENIFELSGFFILTLSALMFASVHWEQGTNSLLGTFILGIFAVAYYYKTRRVLPLIIGHFITLLNIYFE